MSKTKESVETCMEVRGTLVCRIEWENRDFKEVDVFESFEKSRQMVYG